MSRNQSAKFPWNTVKGFKVSSLANGSLLVEPDYIEPWRGEDEGGGPGVMTRIRLREWCMLRLAKRRQPEQQGEKS